MLQDNYSNDAWVLYPDCFCANRPWLSVDGIADEDIHFGVGIGFTHKSGLSKEDRALLATLLTALAIFFFLLFLLLCLFCPRMCCRKGSLCSSRACKTKSSDMTIPRAWTDATCTGYSHSDLDKGRSIWKNTDSDQRPWTVGQHGNENFRDDYFKNGGSMSNYSLNNSWVEVYTDNGTTGRDGRHKEHNSKIMALDEFYDTTNHAVEAVHESSHVHPMEQTENNVQALPVYNFTVQPYAMTEVTTSSMTTTNNMGDNLEQMNVIRDTSIPSYSMVVERTSTYTRKVVEETETVTTD